MSRFLIRPFILSVAAGAALMLAAPMVVAQAPKAPDTVILKGSPMGGVKLNHAVHSKATECTTCHHASKPEKAMKGEYQKCQDCHTKKATPPMKTATRDAFHDAMAKKGVCVDCHVAESAKGNKKVPAKCADCHKKENV